VCRRSPLHGGAYHRLPPVGSPMASGSNAFGNLFELWRRQRGSQGLRPGAPAALVCVTAWRIICAPKMVQKSYSSWNQRTRVVPGRRRRSGKVLVGGAPGCSTRWLTVVRRERILNLMVESTDMSEVFHALAHDARRAILNRLAAGELTVGQLAEPFSMSLEAASKHIRVLERAGLVRRTVQGRRHVCSLEARPLASAAAWMRFYERFWTERLDTLAGLFRPKRRRRRTR